VLDVNVIGTALVSKFAIPHMREHADPSSTSVHERVIAQPNFATYGASRAP